MKRQSPSERPGWDAYFMDIAHVVARRGNCLRRQVAAIIVRDRRIISTGYNGTPRGIENCYEGGCARCASDSPSGENLGYFQPAMAAMVLLMRIDVPNC